MLLRRLAILVPVAAALAGAAYLARETEPPAARMASAAKAFIDSLTAEQKEKTLFPFDAGERTNWHFVPLQDRERKPTRMGLRLEVMTARQKDGARALVRACTSAAGFHKATTIMSLESILRELEKNGKNVRNPDWYFFSIFGTPSQAGTWGLRIEGHHLSLNFTLDRGQVVGFTPCFFGANPANVRQGDRKGLRILAESEDLAKELFAALDLDQRAVALQPRQFREIEQGKDTPHVGTPVGLPAARMNLRQRSILNKLLACYAGRMPAEVAEAEMAEMEKAGLEKIYFAFAQDADKPGKPITYRVQGPTFVVEFLNVQGDSAGNPANHFHTSSRKPGGDFGLASR